MPDSLVTIIDALARGDTAFVVTLISRGGAPLAAAVLRAGVQPGVAGAPPIDQLVQEVALVVAELAPARSLDESAMVLIDRAAACVAKRSYPVTSGDPRPERPANSIGQLSLFSSGGAVRLSVETLRAGLGHDDRTPSEAACSAA